MKGRFAALCMMVMGLYGCSDTTPNNPYPASDQDKKIYYSSFREQPRFLDPAKNYTQDGSVFTEQVYEPILEYHYFKRPYELQPLTAAAMPTVTYYDAKHVRLPEHASADQIAYSVYRIQIQKGIRYAPHPAFAVDEQGQPRYFHLDAAALKGIRTLPDFKYTGTRELKAQDYIYEIKRLADPRIGSPIAGLMMKYIVGFEDFNQILTKEYEKEGIQETQVSAPILQRFDMSGLRWVDDYTYEIAVVGKYPQFVYWLAMSFFVPMPWEADVFYAQQGLIDRNITLSIYPVGTGPFILHENDANRRMTFVRNPEYRDALYPAGGPRDSVQDLAADAGKKMPFIDEAVFTLEKESIPLWTKFLQGYYDLSAIQSDNFDQALQFEGKRPEVTPLLKEKGIQLLKTIQLADYYWGFNMLDPLVGGYTDQKRKLRQAISIAFDTEEYITIFLNDRGTPAQGFVPPNIFGAQTLPQALNRYMYNWVNNKPVRKPLSEAKRLLKEAGYPNGIDPKTGKPLVITYDAVAVGDPLEKARYAWTRKQFNKLGIELNVRETDWNRFLDKLDKGDFQFYTLGWIADYPDAENFAFVLYGPNSKAKGEGPNNTNYNSPDFNALFDKAKSLDNTPERESLIHQMVAVAQKDAPWIWGYHPEVYALKQPWISNVKSNDMVLNSLKYYRIDAELREKYRDQWNQPLFWPIVFMLLFIAVIIAPVLIMYRHKVRHQKPKRY